MCTSVWSLLTGAPYRSFADTGSTGYYSHAETMK
jgi:hypothetical protein